VKNSLSEYIRLFQKINFIGVRSDVQNENGVDFECGSKQAHSLLALYFPFYDSLSGFNVIVVYLARVCCSMICKKLINNFTVNVPFPLR
jgi:hypothetical protein